MNEDIFPSQYIPQESESAIAEAWERSGIFHVDARGSAPPYVVVIPPPNVTGALHIGHALNNTIQDILVRWKRMQGFRALWVPGTDHAGIATQNVVEKELHARGLTRHALGRERFVEEVWKWREKYGSRIITQLKALGASCDWSRLRFTMDEPMSQAVVTAFVSLYRKGLIYKGKRIIHWCPRCTTALADEEVEYREEKGRLYTILYPGADGISVKVATTRPETMLGDTAVAVHPDDARYASLIGATVTVPLARRPVPVIADPAVDREFGTGAVKVTPAHDAADFEIASRHKLPSLTVIGPDGLMTSEAGAFAGMDRFECRRKVVEALRGQRLLERVEEHTHRVGYCYRCGTVIEPSLSTQWFVRMKPLAEPAIRAAEEGAVTFHPERWKKVYLAWLTDIKDWCISRQIWWGHRIPVWYCDAGGCPPLAAETQPEACPVCGGRGLRQDEDVLDTWFSSWLWPFSVFGWPEDTEDLRVFYPTHTLVTAQEILFFWVARMVMAGCEFMGRPPFSDVYIHGTVRDATGRKMSKSLGNAVDPVEIISTSGADSLRFSVVSLTAFGQDVFLPPDFHVKGRNFANKIWNASRFILGKAAAYGVRGAALDEERTDLTMADRWIVSLLNQTIEQVTTALAQFRLNEALNTLYDFFWHSFCDWYLEIAKIDEEQQERFRNATVPVLLHILMRMLALLHPFMPFVTERIWGLAGEQWVRETDFLAAGRWPVPGTLRDTLAISSMSATIEAVSAIRDAKATYRIPNKTMVSCILAGDPLDPEIERLIRRLAGVNSIAIGALPADRTVLRRDLAIGKLAICCEETPNIEREAERLAREREKLAGLLAAADAKLGQELFIARAPAHIVAQERSRRETLRKKIEALDERIAALNRKGAPDGSNH